MFPHDPDPKGVSLLFPFYPCGAPISRHRGFLFSGIIYAGTKRRCLCHTP